jgi:nucleoside-diphosphate-sugar epimerase
VKARSAYFGLTSSFAAVGYGHPAQSTPFTEETWTNINGPGVTPYTKSKTLAERAAWDYVNSPEGKGLELCTIQPTWIFGPVLSEDFSPSILLVQRLLNGDLPGCPDLTLGIVDVRDLASLQLLAMTRPEAVGERFLAVSPPSVTVKQVAMVLKERLPNASKKVTTMQLPNFLLRVLAWFDEEIASVAPALGKKADCTNEKAKRVLGWEPISKEDAIVATAESLIKLGFVKK